MAHSTLTERRAGAGAIVESDGRATAFLCRTELICTGLLFATMAFGTLAFGGTQPWSVWVLETATSAIVVVWIAAVAVRGRAELVVTPAHLFGLGFLMIAGLQIALRRTAYFGDSWDQALVCLMEGMVFAVAAQLFRTRRNLVPFFWMTVLFGGAYALFAMVYQFTGNNHMFWLVPIHHGGWIYGSYINHNHYAGLMEMLAPIALLIPLYSSHSLRGERQAVALLSGVLMAATIFLSSSRGGMFSFALQMTVAGVLVLRGKANLRSGLVFAVLILGLLGMVYWIGSDVLAQRLSSTKLEDPIRYAVNRDAWPMLKEHPWLGWGLGTFPTVYPHFRSVYTDIFVNEAHNDYLQALLETGLAGFAMILGFLFFVLRAGLREMSAERNLHSAIKIAAFVGCCGIVVHSVIDFNLHIPANAMWFLTLCAVVVTDKEPGHRSKVVRFSTTRTER